MSRHKKSSNKKHATETKKSTRLNVKGLAIFCVVVAILSVAGFFYKSSSVKTIRDSAIAQAKENIERGEVELALRHLDRFLQDNPNDLTVLELKADLLTKSVLSTDRLQMAINVLDQLVRLDPDGDGRLDTRRKLIELYIIYGERIRDFADTMNDGAVQAKESRNLAAVQAAEELIRHKDKKTGRENGETDAAAHRLKAMAYMGQVPGLIVKEPADSEVLSKAKDELEIALKIDPNDIIASEKLAELYMFHAKDPSYAEGTKDAINAINAEKTLDRMLESLKTRKFASETEEKDETLKVRLSRFRAYYRAGYLEKAQKELDAALPLAPDNLEIRVSAAGVALQRNEYKECRTFLDGVSAKDQRDNLRVRFLRGALEFAERHPDEAIDQWRKGLSLVGGGDTDLTWRLAANLIQFNRLHEAEPLVKQYQRLAKPNDPLGLYLEGMYAEKSGYLKKAIELMSKASNQVPSSFKSDVLMSLGHCYELVGDESKALYTYNMAANLGGAATGPRRAIARLYQPTNPARAIEELETALAASRASGKDLGDNSAGQESKADPNLLFDLIRIKMDRQLKLAKPDRNFGEVVKLLEEARKIAPENPAFQSLMAQYQSLDNRMDLAVKTLEDTVKGSNRKRVESWLAWAEALEALGQFPQAIEVLDRGAASDAAGDHAMIRTTKARLLLRQGFGSRAREVLTTNLDLIPKPELPELSKALGDLLQQLGDRPGARQAYLEWSRLAPESPFPALKLLSIAQIDGDDEAAKAGLDLLAKLDRANEPYGLAARALQLLRVDPAKANSISPEKLAEVSRLVDKLNQIAPDFPVKYMIQGMMLEAMADPKDPKAWREYLTKAGEAYRKSIKIGAPSPSLPKLIEIYMKLNDNDKLNLLKVEYDDSTKRNKTEIAIEFDRLSTLVALKVGDRKRALENVTEIGVWNPDNRGVRVAESKMNEANGDLAKAEAVLLDLVKLKPQEPINWLELIQFLARRRTTADVARTIDQARQKYKGERPELFLAQCFFVGKDLPSANREFQKAVEARPDDLITLRATVEFRESTNQADQVEPVLRKILKLDPTSVWAADKLALLLSARGEYPAWLEAWSLVSPGSSTFRDLPEDRLIRGTILARSPEAARKAEAIPAFAALANDLPISDATGIEARLRLSQAMLELDRPADAWQYISPVADDLTRDNPLALAIGIESLARLGQAFEADKRLGRLSLIIPNANQLALSKGWVLFAQGKKQEAAASVLGLFDKVEKEPDGQAISMTCLELLTKFRDLDSALILAKKMTAKWPRQVASLARIQVARGDYEDALNSCRLAIQNGSPREAVQFATAVGIARRTDKSVLKKVEEIGDLARNKAPNDYNILVYLATIRHLEDKYEQEIAFYRMALEQNPTNRQFLNNMAWTLSEGLKKTEEASKWIEELISREGPAPQYLDTRGVIQTRLKNYDQAIADLEKSVQAEPLALTYYHLARAYLRAGKVEDSRRCRDLAVAKKFDVDSLDPTDKTDLKEVMGKP